VTYNEVNAMFDNLREESSNDFEEQAKFQPAAGTRRAAK
jgi:hypothetical protein